MSYYGSGGQNGGSVGRGGGGSGQQGQGALLSGPPQHQQQHQHQLFVNPNSIQFSTATQNFTFPGSAEPQGQLQLNTGGAPLLLQPPVNFVTDQLGLGQLITQAAAQSQQNLQNIMSLGSVLAQPSIQLQQQQDQSGAGGGGQSKQRVFTGTVTKIHDNFGFIDEEVFFQMGVVKGPVLPKEGDRVLVEADFNPSMPFKWNATRVQIVNMGGGLSNSNNHQQQQNHSQNHQQQQQQSGYQQQQLLNFPSSMSGSKVPPPPNISNQQQQQMNSGGGRSQQSVSIVSNPHSIYSSGGGGAPRPSNTNTSHAHNSHSHLLPEPLSNNSRRAAPSIAQQLAHNLMVPEPPLISPQMNLPSLLQMERDRRESSRERDRKEREREDRQRDRSKERQRERDRERRERRSRSRSKERERRRRSPTPPVKRRSRERKESDREKDKVGGVRGVVDRITRDRSSPLPPTTGGAKGERGTRRSRSRDTVKSNSDTKSVSNADRDGSAPRPNRSKVNSSTNKPPTASASMTRYSLELPKFTLDTLELNIMEMKRRYPNLYVPSDFFLVRATWMETFPLFKPFQLGKPCPVHIFGRHVNPIHLQQTHGTEVSNKAIANLLDAPDSSCTFKVKVMILSSGSLELIYKKTGVTSGNSGGKDEKETLHPLQRLLSFVVGLKTGKQEVLALGGTWSSSLDGQNPQSDPKVLINTAVRSVKALAGLDLSTVTHWYRFMELYYRRSNGNLETTVYFLPDLSTSLPSSKEWAQIKSAHRIALHGTKVPVAVPIVVDKKSDVVKSGSVVVAVNKSSSEPTSTKKTESKSRQNSTGEDSIAVGVAVSTEETVEKKAGTGEELGAVSKVSKVSPGTEAGEEEDVDIMQMEVVDECNGDEAELDVAAAVTENTTTTLLLHQESEQDDEAAGDEGGTAAANNTKGDTSFDIYDDIVEVTGEVMSPNKAVVVSMEEEAKKNGPVQPIVTAVEEESIESKEEVEERPKGTHFSQIEPKNLNVAKLREELSIRNLSTKGLKSQLTMRLAKALKDEETKEEEESKTKEENLVVTQEKESDEKNPSEEVVGIRLVDPSTILEPSAAQLDESLTESHASMSANAGEEVTKCDEKMEDGEIKEEEPGSEVKVVGGIIKEGMSSDEIGIWERRWEVPKNPKLLLYPATSGSSGGGGKAGLFDCSSMTLSSLRDYRIVDRKEESFEVSLFSELFYEMLTRDFAFRIYQEIVRRADKAKDKETHINSKASTKPTLPNHKKKQGCNRSRCIRAKKRRRNAWIQRFIQVRGVDDDDKGKGKDTPSTPTTGPPSKKRKTSAASKDVAASGAGDSTVEKMKTVEPYLLLAFLFFDQNRCGYMTETTLEDICAALGLRLTRSQLRKKIQKVMTKGSLEYRKWTDKAESEILKEEQDEEKESKEQEFETIQRLSQGNKGLLPVFTYSCADVIECLNGEPGMIENGVSKKEELSSVLVTLDGHLVDVRKMKDQLEKAEKERMAAEANANVLKNSLNEAKNQVAEFKKSSETLKEDLFKTKESLKKLENCDKSNKDDLEVFRRATERFVDRVKDMVKLPSVPSNNSSPSKDKEAKVKDDKDNSAK